MLDPSEVRPAKASGRALLWTVVPIALGLLVLLGGAVAGGLYAFRNAGSGGPVATPSPSPPSKSPSPPGKRPSAPALPAPGHVPPPAELDVEPGDEPEDEPPVRVALPLSAKGERWLRAERGALLPVGEGETIWGDANAHVTVTLFGDLECMHTRAALAGVARLGKHFGERLRLVFHHRPLTDGASAETAGRALAAVTLQRGPDAAWQVLTAAAASRSPADAAEVRRWLDSAGVDADVAALASDPRARAELERDAQLSAVLHVQATPTLFVNGRRIIGRQSDAALTRAVEDELRAVRWLHAEGAPREQIYGRRVKANLIGVADGALDRACVPVDGAPSAGPARALVTIVEFSGFQCSHCHHLSPVLAQVIARHPGRVRRVWRSFVLPQHERGARSAAFALAARALGGERAFWAVHRALFAADSERLDDAHLAELASGVGLDGARLLVGASDPEHARKLGIDQQLAEDLNLRGTPTIFVNGRQLSGAVSFAVLDAIVREEIAAAQRVVRNGTPIEQFEHVLCAQ